MEWNREPRNRPTQIHLTWFGQQCKSYQGRIDFSKNGTETVGHPSTKTNKQTMNLNLNLTHLTQKLNQSGS